MKKLLLGLFLFLSSFASAQFTYQFTGNTAATGSTIGYNVSATGATIHKIVWTVQGTLNTCSITVDTSADNSSWSTGGAIGSQTCTSNGSAQSTTVIANYVRVSYTIGTGGGTLTFNTTGYINTPSGGGTVTSVTCGTGLSCSPGSPITGSGTINATGSGGALVQLETHAASNSATLDFTTCISGSTYHQYMFQVRSAVPATNSQTLQMVFSTNGGSSWDTTSGHYAWAAFGMTSGGTEVVGSTSDVRLGLSDTTSPISNTANLDGISENFTLYDPLGAHEIAFAGLGSYVFSGTNPSGMLMLGGHYTVTTGAVNAVRFQFNSGNIVSGTVTCYGVTP